MTTCKITEVNGKAFEEAKEDFKKQVTDLQNKNGLMIILAMTTDQGVSGSAEDIARITATFKNEKINFAIWLNENPNHLQIPAIMKVAASHNYPSSINKIFIYYSGHGGIEKGRKFVIPYSEDSSRPRSYICEDMIMFFEPSSECKLGANVSRVFLFDCCLSTTEQAEPTVPLKDIHLTSVHQPLLIAHATSMGHVSSGVGSSGGFWTKPLCENILKFYYLPFSCLLDVTWEDVVERKSKQGPHYLCYTGQIFFKDEYCDIYYKMNSAKAIKSGVPAPIISSGSSKGSSSYHTQSTNDDTFTDDIDRILDLRPDKQDLLTAIATDLNNSGPKIWKDKFGKRLKGPNNTKVSTCLKVEYLINLFYDEAVGGPYPITWGSVLNALENPTPLRRRPDDKEIAMSLREFLIKNYKKYDNRL